MKTNQNNWSGAEKIIFKMQSFLGWDERQIQYLWYTRHLILPPQEN
jgi:hypothetical protein